MGCVRAAKAALAAVILILGFASAASAACQLQQTADYKLTMDGNRALLDGAINGQPVRFMLDTGAFTSMLFPSAVARLGLKAYVIDELNIYGVGGGAKAARASVRDLKLGNAVAHNVDLLVNKHDWGGAPYVGLVGEDILSQGDLELDLADGAARLFRPKDCVGEQVAYWAKNYDVTPLVPSQERGAVQIYVMLNGRRILAELDSGADTSIVTSGGAAIAGVTPHTEGVRQAGQTGGLGPHLVQTSLAVFPTFTIGEETIKNAKLAIADMFAADTEVPLGSRLGVSVVNTPQMLLGADFIRAHRIYVARSQGQVYFSYNGGPIFQVVGPRAEEAPAPIAIPAKP
jgi:hypothetical protein